MSQKVAKIVEEKGYLDFNFVTHSLGSYVLDLAIRRDDFPVDKLRNVISLASPFREAPQLFTGDLV